MPGDPQDGGLMRGRLALRAERAAGLRYVPKPRRAPAAAAAEAAPIAASPAVRSPAAAAPPRRPTAAAAPVAPPTTLLTPVFTGPILPPDEKRAALTLLDETHVKGCTKCGLCSSRTQTVFGEGDPDSRLMFIGEGPGENEDLTGRPFVGRAGELLAKMIVAMGLSRDRVYIANVVKCRPPGNRTPAPDEVAACSPYLERQVEIIRPSVIVALGLTATQHLLASKVAMGKARGQWHVWRGIRVMPTYHPSYVLRTYTDEVRATVWGDLQLVMGELGLPVRGA